MSLRIFHMVFIVASILLSLFVAVWGAREFAVEGSTSGLLTGLTFLVCGTALAFYASKAFDKLKELAR